MEPVAAALHDSSFPQNAENRPQLALITNRHSCDSEKHLTGALTALEAALSTQQVDLVSVRINHHSGGDHEDRVIRLAQTLAAWANPWGFRLVLSSDWRHLLSAVPGVHGVHVKEHDRSCIPELRRQQQNNNVLIGTSCHSLASAREAQEKYQVDYIFVGTCYVSQSHPEKGEDQLEGPELPGVIRRTLKNKLPVLAIGGIQKFNCHVPIEHGANGVAAIQAILQAEDPHQAVLDIRKRIQEAVANRESEVVTEQSTI